MKRTAQIVILAIVAVFAFVLYQRSVSEGMDFTRSALDYSTLDGTNNLMGQPIEYKKCLCNQQGSALYPQYDGLGTRLFRNVDEWNYKGDTNYDAKYFSGVV